MTVAELEKILTHVVHGPNATPDQRITLPSEAQEQPLDELDVDSLARAELMTVLSDTCQIEISDEQATVLTTPRKILEFVDSRATKRASA
ncbi:acyl carrier protein [Amycolatopsis azurea]|uniref:Carrier domain-containing protein n=1 Tax=Amycolatopsis azurea DSM 43854 TaxID=1238180 RepID=M2NNE9_9PSEU|nr:phosphopantetheine-binding protein [Amycolatopsis azurea]EMD23709.1 hypothetical protein C791_6795 [Amycolatopsis azurea DSM 43854]OOC03237.1 hypothetical protein B0293_28715 [Amycolatopsis azurea DSM 43854]